MLHRLAAPLLLALPHAACAAGQDATGQNTADQVAAVQAEPAPQPNIVFLFADDLGWRDVGFMGSDYYRTPNLDALAAGSAVFDSAYSNAPNCAPSRAAIMTGMYAPRTGVYTVSPSTRGKNYHRRLIPTPNTKFLEPEVVTIAELIDGAGYDTCHIGKWHVGEHEGPTSPTEQGFDRNIAGWRKGHPASYHSPYKNPALEDGPDGEYLTDRLTDEAVAFISEDRDEPFFLYMPYYTVHTPIQPRKDLADQTESWTPGEFNNNSKYAAMVWSLDQSVGRILEAVEQIGEADNTIVVFTSDNGGHDGITRMDPLRGSKGMPYEGGDRVPLAIRWPGVTEPGTRLDTPVLLFDLYPTLAAAAGADMSQIPESQQIDAESILPILSGKTAGPDRPLFWHFPAYLQSYRNGLRWRATPYSTIRLGDWKLIEQYETESVELYNLADDIGETTNLAESKPAVARRLLARLHAWQAGIGAPTEFELNPAYDPER